MLPHPPCYISLDCLCLVVLFKHRSIKDAKALLQHRAVWLQLTSLIYADTRCPHAASCGVLLPCFKHISPSPPRVSGLNESGRGSKTGLRTLLVQNSPGAGCIVPLVLHRVVRKPDSILSPPLPGHMQTVPLSYLRRTGGGDMVCSSSRVQMIR